LIFEPIKSFIKIAGYLASLISANGAHTCTIVMGGRIFCWGSNSDGQLGIFFGSLTFASSPAEAVMGQGSPVGLFFAV
jgi:hypothetical protein